MPALIHAFFMSLAALIPSLVGKVLTSLGFGYVTYQIGSFSIDSIAGYISQNAAALPNEVLAVIILAQGDTVISILLGSYAAAFAFKGLQGGKVTKLSVRGGQQ